MIDDLMELREHRGAERYFFEINQVSLLGFSNIEPISDRQYMLSLRALRLSGLCVKNYAGKCGQSKSTPFF
jgi:hypothetical protein